MSGENRTVPLPGHNAQVLHSRLYPRRLVYPLLLVIIYILWFAYMLSTNSWGLFEEFWPISVTMSAGSFIAGATAEGGAAVAFPVFTKALHIPSADARTFGLMIQSVGMTTAALVIIVRRIRFLPHVVGWVTFGGIFGMSLGTLFLTIPNPYPRILFTGVATTFGIALIISRWIMKLKPRVDLPKWNNLYRTQFFTIGLIGGAFASNTGSGIDMLTFIVLVLAFGINEKISTPTTVIIMGLNSVVGFFMHGIVLQDVGIAWSYWLVAIPIVIIGAPLGAFVCSFLKRDFLIIFLLSLIGLELATTIWLIPFDTTMILVTFSAMAISVIWFWLMLLYRQRSTQLSQ